MPEPILARKEVTISALKASVKDDRTLSHRVNAGNDLGSELGDYHHDDACQEAGLQKQGLWVELQIQVRGKDSHLDDLRDVEQEFSVVAVDRCQLGGKEDQTHDKDLVDNNEQMLEQIFWHLATQKKPFNVVSLGSNLSEPEYDIDSSERLCWENWLYL